jgi:hypothetical protein
MAMEKVLVNAANINPLKTKYRQLYLKTQFVLCNNNVYMRQLVCVEHLIQLRHTTRTNCHIYMLLSPDEGLLASPKHVEV